MNNSSLELASKHKVKPKDSIVKHKSYNSFHSKRVMAKRKHNKIAAKSRKQSIQLKRKGKGNRSK